MATLSPKGEQSEYLVPHSKEVDTDRSDMSMGCVANGVTIGFSTKVVHTAL